MLRLGDSEMPTCYVTISEIVRDLDDSDLEFIRDVVATGLTSKSRFLDRNHIVLRVQRSKRLHMLGDVELEVFCQFYLRRTFSRDMRAHYISKNLSNYLTEKGISHPKGVATWINMVTMGYTRVQPSGEIHKSDKTKPPASKNKNLNEEYRNL